ncbi:MAG: cupin domain-containing protein [Alphaproteobacteria bacterium]|nr:cupin domain-containing protein [Alphaproteobacteria bacterium]
MATRPTIRAPEGSLSEDLAGHVKTFATRDQNWKVFSFETAVNPKYARPQLRYLGTSGNVDHTDPKALMGRSFTFSLMQLPPGNEQPLHHHDEEEVFFVLEGTPTVVWEHGGEIVMREVGKWDLVYNPPGQVHCIRNYSDAPCWFQVMLGNPKPPRPQYLDPELRKLQVHDRPDEIARAK